MRFLVVLMALISLPGVLALHHRIFVMNTQNDLSAEVGKVIGRDQEFKDVQATIEYLDVKLTGEVDSPEDRERAQMLVDAVHGVRCRPGDNRLTVRPHLDGKLQGNTLSLHGWMPDVKTLEEMANWLVEARRGLVVDVSNVSYPSAVLPMEVEGDDKIPILLKEIWPLIQVPVSLRIESEADASGKIILTGKLPEGTANDALMLALQKARPNALIESAGLEIGRYVKAREFVEGLALPELLEKFFAGAGPRTLEIDEKRIHLTATVVASEPPTWQPLLEAISGELKPTLQLNVFPSVWHMPGYKYVSTLDEPALKALREVLAQNVVLFLPGEMTVIETEFAKLDSIAQAIIAGGQNVRIVVGGYPETKGDFAENAIAASRRAEAVVTALLERGVAPEVLQAVVYEPAPGTYAALARGVECLIK